MNNQFPNEFDEYAFHYFESLRNPLRNFVNKDDEYFIEAKTNIIKELLTLYFKDTQAIKIIDVGAGVGLFESLLQGRNINIFGMDISFKMMQVAKYNNVTYRGSYCQANAFHLPYPNNSADIVFSSCVLHHIPDDNKKLIISEMYRVCKPDGHIIIFEHNPYNLFTQLVVKTTPIDKNAQLISYKKLFSLIKNIGLVDCKVKYFLYGLRGIDKWININLKFLSHIPVGGQYCVIYKKELI